MKKLFKSFSVVATLLFGGMAVVSCDPCAGVVCSNGTCSNGSCICEPGHEKQNQSCIPFNETFAGTYTNVTQNLVDTSTTPTTNTTVTTAYDIEVEASGPYKFVLKSFDAFVYNDVTFTVSESNSDVIVSETVTTAANKTYMVSGARTGNTLSLTLEAPPKTWTLTMTK